MSRVSKIKIDADLESEIINQFWNFLGNIGNSRISSEFFSDFLTNSERIMLSKRFATLILLAREKSPTEIQNSIHVTFSTIGSVSAWLKNAKPETQKLINNISKGKGWENLLDKIDEILDKLPPKIYTNWGTEYKGRYVRAKQRSLRESLR